jgi:hypothetical protein
MVDVPEVQPPGASDVVELVDEIPIAEPLSNERGSHLKGDGGEGDSQWNGDGSK